jgi:uncharacterized membrane protein YvbJ
MVYCSKCGTLNSDNANICSNCGAALFASQSQSQTESPHWRRRQYREEYREYYRGRAGVGALFFGIVVLAIGLILFLSVTLNVPAGGYIWPTILILVGLWVLFIGLRRNRRNRYTQPPPQ